MLRFKNYKQRFGHWIRVHWIFRLESVGFMAFVATFVLIAFIRGYISAVWFTYLFVISIGILIYLTQNEHS